MVSIVIIAIGGVLLLVLGVAVFAPIWRAFVRELKYVDMKIMSSINDKETAYWERRKKSLWMSLLPFHHYDPHNHRHHEDQ